MVQDSSADFLLDWIVGHHVDSLLAISRKTFAKNFSQKYRLVRMNSVVPLDQVAAR